MSCPAVGPWPGADGAEYSTVPGRRGPPPRWPREPVATLVAWLTGVATPADGNRAGRVAIDRAHSAKAPAAAQTIKLADLIDDAESIVRHDRRFARVYLEEKRQLLDVADAWRRAPDAPRALMPRDPGRGKAGTGRFVARAPTPRAGRRATCHDVGSGGAVARPVTADATGRATGRVPFGRSETSTCRTEGDR